MIIKTRTLENGTVCVDKKTFCCKKMQSAYEKDFIIFGEADQDYNYEKKVNLTHCDDYLDGAVWDTMEIKYCPFCKAEIIID